MKSIDEEIFDQLIDLSGFEVKTQSKKNSRKFIGVALDKFIK